MSYLDTVNFSLLTLSIFIGERVFNTIFFVLMMAVDWCNITMLRLPAVIFFNFTSKL